MGKEGRGRGSGEGKGGWGLGAHDWGEWVAMGLAVEVALAVEWEGVVPATTRTPALSGASTHADTSQQQQHQPRPPPQQQRGAKR